ncbi:MAG: hypothetical protein J7M18_02030 [Candidatus Eremiobacteraeota bacterium]|nr:hypothetical protein [Candidatus Eremiobacteraeota bacterium]
MDDSALKKQRNELTIGFLIMGVFVGAFYGYSYDGIIATIVRGLIGGGIGAAVIRILYLPPKRTYSMLGLGIITIVLGGLFLKSWGALAGVIILWLALMCQPFQETRESAPGNGDDKNTKTGKNKE